MQPHDSISIQNDAASTPELTYERLRFISSRGPDDKDALFLISYPTLESQANGEGSSYRSDGLWIEVSNYAAKDDWFFEGFDDDAPAFYFSHQYLDRLVVPYLRELAVKWYDSLVEAEDVRTIPDIFCADTPHLAVQRLEGSPDYSIELVTNGGLWTRSGDHSWNLKAVLSQRDIYQRRALTDVAERLIHENAQPAALAEDDWDPRNRCAEASLGAALALGAPLTVIPTFDALLFRLAAHGTLDWESCEHLLAHHAEAGFICDENDLAAELVVQHRVRNWIRSNGRWVPARGQWSDGQTFIPFELEMLPDAVDLWDKETRTPAAVPAPYSAPTSLSFVTDADPLDVRDYPLLGLVRGSINDGTGWTRTPGFWEWEYVDVLDFENHLPANEGDMRPWGGRYLCGIPQSLEALAITYWDSHGDRYGFPVAQFSWSDFVTWMKTET